MRQGFPRTTQMTGYALPMPVMANRSGIRKIGRESCPRCSVEKDFKAASVFRKVMVVAI